MLNTKMIVINIILGRQVVVRLLLAVAALLTGAFGAWRLWQNPQLLHPAHYKTDTNTSTSNSFNTLFDQQIADLKKRQDRKRKKKINTPLALQGDESSIHTLLELTEEHTLSPFIIFGKITPTFEKKQKDPPNANTGHEFNFVELDLKFTPVENAKAIIQAPQNLTKCLFEQLDQQTKRNKEHIGRFLVKKSNTDHKTLKLELIDWQFLRKDHLGFSSWAKATE